MKLEIWSIIEDGDPYVAPELRIPRLHGFVYENSKFPDGENIYTSRIIGKEGNCVVTKTGSRYELGEVDPNYEKQYPGARERLFLSLKEV